MTVQEGHHEVVFSLYVSSGCSLPRRNGKQYNNAFFSLLTILILQHAICGKHDPVTQFLFFLGRNGDKTAFPPGAWDAIFGQIKIPRWFVSDIIYPAPARRRLTLLMSSAGGRGSNWGVQVGRKHPRTRPSPLQRYLYHRLKKTSLSYVFTRFKIHHLILVIAYKIIYELPTPRRITLWWI